MRFILPQNKELLMYKAIKSFSGVISMGVGDAREIDDASIATDLLKAGYIIEVKPAEKAEKKAINKEADEVVKEAPTKEATPKKTTRKRSKKD